MKIAIMQPYLFPYMGYFQLINAVDKFVLFDDVNYINRGWINRNRILVQGKAHLFTLPLKKAGQNNKINEIYITEKDKWSKRFLRTVETTYRKAPFFEDMFETLRRSLNCSRELLGEFVRHTLSTMCAYLEIDTAIIKTSAVYGNQDLKGQDRIVDICAKEGASEYVNAAGGQELYNRDAFDNKGISLKFIRTGDISYSQFNGEFVPGLSIIDVMMFNGKEQTRKMLQNYALRE